MKHKKYSSYTSYNDMLFNVLIGFVLLFILAFMLINPITKKADIPAKAEIMVVLDWDDMSKDDVDLWIKGTGMVQPLSFQVKNADFWHLDRDDLGESTDVTYVAGERVMLRYNREVATMRGLMPGDFNINVHMYKKKDTKPTNISITLIDVNPYKELYKMNTTLTKDGQVVIFPSFSVDKDGVIYNTFQSDVIFARQPAGDPIADDSRILLGPEVN
tara:strand:- start:2904 stop:3551 length:648 start_codon:yes stop_codon:yes gene_type:complete